MTYIYRRRVWKFETVLLSCTQASVRIPYAADYLLCLSLLLFFSPSSKYPFLYSLISSFISVFSHFLFISYFMYFVYLFIYLFTYLFSCSFICLFIHSLILSLLIEILLPYVLQDNVKDSSLVRKQFFISVFIKSACKSMFSSNSRKGLVFVMRYRVIVKYFL